MDMVKQALAAIAGSAMLAGCLTDPNIVYVPDTEMVDTENETDGDGEDGTALLWQPQGYLFPGRDPGFPDHGRGCSAGFGLAQLDAGGPGGGAGGEGAHGGRHPWTGRRAGATGRAGQV